MEQKLLMIRYLPILTGSSGNLIYLDFNGGQRTILDAGIPYEDVYDILKPYHCHKYWVNLLISHDHQDHYKFYSQFKHRFKSNKNKLQIEKYALPHGDVFSHAYILTHTESNKVERVLWMTDFHEITPELQERVQGKHFDLVLIEANWSAEQVLDNLSIQITGYLRHHSLESTQEFLKTFTWGQVELIHISQINMDGLLLLNYTEKNKNIVFSPEQYVKKYNTELKYVNENMLRKKILLQHVSFVPKEFEND